MTYEEISTYLEMGMIVKSEQCLYLKIHCEDCVYWKWIGEETWSRGSESFEECVNDSEKDEIWSIAFNCNSFQF